MPGGYLIDRLAHCRFVSDINLMTFKLCGMSSSSLLEGGEFLRLTVRDRDLAQFRQKCQADGLAERSCTARNQHDLI